MKRIILSLVLILASITFCHAQKIESEQVFGGYKYTLNGKKVVMKDLVNLMKNDAKSYELIKKGQSNNTLANIIGAVGGGLVGYPLGTAAGGGNANWTLAAIGAGLIVVAIPIASSAKKNTNRAVNIYNRSLGVTSSREIKPEFKLLLNGNRIGLAINF